MQTCTCFVILLVMSLMTQVTSTQELPPSPDDTSLLLTALCFHDNRIRESCLQSVHAKQLLSGLLLTLNSPALRINDANVDADESQKIVLPDKRRREQDQLSGFYSNW